MRVYGLMCEDDGNELWRRQYSINQTLGLRMEDLNNSRFVSRVGSNNLLMTFDGKDAGKHTELFHKLMADITEFAPDVVILDTAADLFGGNEINRTQVRQFVQNVCGNIARSINGAVVLCAHPSDSGIQRNTGTGGSTAWNNTVRSRWYLTRPPEDEETDPNERILSRKKSNYASSGEAIKMLWQDGTFVYYHPDPNDKRRVGETMGQRQKLERKRKKDAILELIANEALKGKMYLATPFAQVFEDKMKLGSASTIRRSINTYATKGWIKYCTDYEKYGLPKPPSAQGYLCVQGMQFPVNTDGIDPETGEAKQKLVPIYPTHFRNSKSQALCEVEDPTIWIEKDGKNEEVEDE
jgi:RecA-family ATPase